MFFGFYETLFNKDKNEKGQIVKMPTLQDAANRVGETFKPFFDWVESYKRPNGSYDETRLLTLGKWYFRRYMQVKMTLCAFSFVCFFAILFCSLF